MSVLCYNDVQKGASKLATRNTKVLKLIASQISRNRSDWISPLNKRKAGKRIYSNTVVYGNREMSHMVNLVTLSIFGLLAMRALWNVYQFFQGFIFTPYQMHALIAFEAPCAATRFFKVKNFVKLNAFNSVLIVQLFRMVGSRCRDKNREVSNVNAPIVAPELWCRDYLFPRVIWKYIHIFYFLLRYLIC